MDMPPSAATGFVDSLRALGDGLIAGLQERIALFVLEVQEEKYRLIHLFIWISAAAFTAMMAITFASITLVYCFWESARLTVLTGLTLFYTTALVAIIIALRRFIARQPGPFAATRREIGADRSCIRERT